MEKVAVLPVPDWAWAMTSWPLMTGTIARCWMAEGRSKLEGRKRQEMIVVSLGLAHP